MKEEKLFDIWNSQKKAINKNICKIYTFPQTRDVWICVFGKNIGFEQNGTNSNFSRPALVVKKFNNQMFWVVPLSTKQKDYDFYFNFMDHAGQNVSVILAQIRLVSVKRFVRKLYKLPDNDFDAVTAKLKAYFD